MKKGFTLIELLAVIVILAIIAVIAVPIVLNIIDETKSNATLRSADFYLDAAELSIAQATLKNKNIKDGTYSIKDGDICLNETCTEILEVEVNGKVPKYGTIVIEKGNIEDVTLDLNNKIILKNDEGNLDYSICTLLYGGKNKVGAKYECEVKPGTKYEFFVLSHNEDGTTNLILDRNINSDGTLATKSIRKQYAENGIYNKVEWCSQEDYISSGGEDLSNDEGQCSVGGYCANNNKGPVTAVKFLYNATKDWTNVPPLNYTYNDREFQTIIQENTGYTSFVSQDGITTITPYFGNNLVIGSKEEPLRARMPIYSDEETNVSYYNWIDETPISFWTLSSYKDGIFRSWLKSADGMIDEATEFTASIRPIITLKVGLDVVDYFGVKDADYYGINYYTENWYGEVTPTTIVYIDPAKVPENFYENHAILTDKAALNPGIEEAFIILYEDYLVEIATFVFDNYETSYFDIPNSFILAMYDRDIYDAIVISKGNDGKLSFGMRQGYV